MVEQFELDFMGFSESSQETQEIHAQIALLKNAVDPDDVVLMDYVEIVAPQMLEEYTLRSAKGSTGWAYNHDQSMLAHILNGIFPTLTIVRSAEQPLSELEERLYLIAYSFHDIDKLEGIRDLSVSDAEKSERFYSYLDEWVAKLHFDRFCPDYTDYREDIGYLILNTQKRYGANLNLQSYDLRLPGRRRQYLREMCTTSDLIAYFLKNPSGFREQASIRESLVKLSGGKLEFAYHKLAENRGMITNVINNALLRILRDRLGWKPFLFFPIGVTYLRERSSVEDTLPMLAEIAEDVEKELISYCAGRLETNLNGFTRDGKGFKFPDYYYDFFQIPQLLKLIGIGCFRILHENKSPSAGKRLQKMLQLQEKGDIPADITLHFEDDMRVDQLAEYLYEIEKHVGAITSREAVSSELVRALNMQEHQTAFEAIPRDNRAGGVPLHWYFFAGKYLMRNRGLDPNQMEDLFTNIANQVASTFEAEIERHETEKEGFGVLREYVEQAVDINGHGEIEHNFEAELDRYTNTKKKGRGSNSGCSLCSSAFETSKQRDTSVIFANQVYSNKNLLNSSLLVRGICELCEVEMMLRQIMIRSKLKLVGSGYDDVKIKWLYLYPSYFFTTETAKFVGDMYHRLKNLNFFEIRKVLHKGMTVSDFINLDETVIDTEISNPDDDYLLKMQFDTNDLATFYFCGIPTLGNSPTDTESWAVPTFLGLLMPLVFNAKVVVTESQIPLYHSSEEWKETVILNAPHSFVKHILGTVEIRIDQIEEALKKIVAVYDINIDVFQKDGKPQWQHLNEIGRNINTDPLYVFHYLEAFRRKQGWDSFPKPRDGELSIPERYIQNYQNLGGDKMSFIEEVANRCFKFYGPDNFNPNSVLKVITLVEDVIVNSEPKICSTDLKYQAIGEVSNLMQRIRTSRAQGYARLRRDEEPLAIHELVEYFYHTVFIEYYEGERGMLRQRRNRFNAGVYAWYQVNWRQFQTKKAKEDNNAGN